MVKSKSSSTSKVKLTNKSTNKRMKSKRKHKFNRSNKLQTQVNIPSTNKVAKNEKIRSVPDSQVEEEMNEEELAFSDEEMLDYINVNSQKMTLLTSDFSKKDGTKKSKEVSAAYENVPRAFSKRSEDQSNDKKVELLPFKGERGLIQRSREVAELPKNDDEEKDVEDSNTPVESEIPKQNALSLVEILANHRADINSKKLRIAQLSQDIIESPDKVGGLKDLTSLCNRDQPVAIRKLSMLSLVEVFKDIIPSYRIRELTEQERVIKVSRDVCALREFENTLLSNYQTYLSLLEDVIKDCFKVLKRNHTNGMSKKSDLAVKPMVSLAMISAQCLCELLRAVPHFNFRSNIIAVVVPKIGLSGDLSEVGTICFNGVKTALIADKVGDVSLEIVKVVNKEVKSKVHVKPKVLEVLVHLQLNSDAIKAAEEKGNKLERLRKKKEAIMKMSKKEKKKKKFEDQLNKEMQEAEAVENRDRIERWQTEVLKFLFVIYFRVLKTDHVSSLLPSVLQGLAKFSHLINVDYFHDLMAAIEKKLWSEDVGLNESLNCIRTAMKILSGQGELLTIDPKQFYTELYARLLFISADTVDIDVGMAKRCVEEMIIKRKKQVSVVQVVGFFKRLATLLLQLSSEKIMEYSLLVRNILQIHKKCEHLLDNDTCSRGAFQPEVPDPEYCNAESSTLWELALLSTHYQPQLNTISKHILNGAPSQGIGSLPSKVLSRMSANPNELEELDNYFPDFIHPKSTSKCFQNTNVNTWRNKTLVSSVEDHVKSVIESDIGIGKMYPPAKRKKCSNS